MPPGALRAMLGGDRAPAGPAHFGGKLADADRETERSVGAFPADQFSH